MSPSRPLRTLVIDDSAFSRRSLTRALETSPLVEVIGTCADAGEALRLCLALKPDLVTLDLEMPRMDGFTFLRLLMARHPTPVIVVSGRTGHSDVFSALELGAVDFVAKPRPGFGGETFEAELLRKVHAVRELRLDRVRARLVGAPPALDAERRCGSARFVAIGASTGGPTAVLRLLGAFAAPPSCAFLVAQHMPAGFTAAFARRIDRLTSFAVREAEVGDEPAPGTVLVAPGDRHLVFEAVQGRVVAALPPPESGERYAPAVDRLFASAAKHWGPELLAVVLTGMGSDGRRGAAAVRAAGGRVIAESADTAVVYGMPQQVIREGLADAVLPLDQIAEALCSPREGAGK